MTYDIPVRVVSEANRRDHWAVKQKRKQPQREMAYLCTLAEFRKAGEPKGPYLVSLEVHYARMPMDSDNLAAACKAVRDGIAAGLGLKDDKDSATTVLWGYLQVKVPSLTMEKVRVTITQTLPDRSASKGPDASRPSSG